MTTKTGESVLNGGFSVTPDNALVPSNDLTEADLLPGNESRLAAGDFKASLLLPEELMEQLQSETASTYDLSPSPLDLPDLFTHNPQQLKSALRLGVNNRMSRVTFDTYASPHLFISQRDLATSEDDDVMTQINSQVVASAINGFQIRNLSSPVFISFKLNNVSFLELSFNSHFFVSMF